MKTLIALLVVLAASTAFAGGKSKEQCFQEAAKWGQMCSIENRCNSKADPKKCIQEKCQKQVEAAFQLCREGY
jgi:hypothetical protein